MSAYPVFLRTLEKCDATIRELGATWSIIEELQRDKDSSKVNEVRHSMPLTCSVLENANDLGPHHVSHPLSDAHNSHKGNAETVRDISGLPIW